MIKQVRSDGNRSRVVDHGRAMAGCSALVVVAALILPMSGAAAAETGRNSNRPFIWPDSPVPTLIALNVNDPVPIRASGGQAAQPPASGPFVRATTGGAEVGVKGEFSTWSDITALFRPSRWANPMAAGGSLSWLNPGAWSAAPGRTAKVLVGELVVAGAVVAVVSAASDDDDSPQATATAATPTSSGASSGGTSGGSSSSGGSSGGTSDGGGTDGGTTPPPTPPPSGGGDENPFG